MGLCCVKCLAAECSCAVSPSMYGLPEDDHETARMYHMDQPPAAVTIANGMAICRACAIQLYRRSLLARESP